MTRYLCGFARACTARGKRPLQLALQHLEQEYVAVGLLERHADTMRLFRHLLPGFFSAYPVTAHIEVSAMSNESAALTSLDMPARCGPTTTPTALKR